MANNENDNSDNGRARWPLPRPIEDRFEYEQSIAALPPERRELAEQLTAYADMCKYLEGQNMEVPPQIRHAMAQVSTLPESERAAAVERINQQLMEFVNDVGEDNGVRN